MTLSRRTLLTTSTAACATLAFGGCKDDDVPDVQKTSEAPHITSPNIGGAMTASAAVILDEATDMILKAYPESATSFGIDTGKYEALKSKLTDRSLAGQDKIASDVGAMLTKLNTIKTENMEGDAALNVEVVRSVFETAAAGFDFGIGDMPLLNSNWSYRPSPYAVAQNTGAFVEIPSFLDSSHKIETASDADAYLSRMTAYAAQLDGETERVKRDGAAGVILPDFLMAKTTGQLKAALAKPDEEWGIAKSFFMISRDSLSDGKSKEIAIAIVKDEIRPAVERQLAALEALVPQAKSGAGCWQVPNGDEYYSWALRAATTTTMSPDEVHEMGRDELASLHGRMDPILRKIGYTDGSVGERMTALAKDKRYHFAPGDKGRAEIMAFIEEKVAEIRALMPQAHNTLVPGFLEVTRISPDVEDGAPGAYGGAGSIDGTKPGHFWINLRTTELHNKYTLPDLTYHEAIPGHVWQGEYTFKQPLIRSLLAFNAYSEGWALYAEQIADELGVYDEFEVGRLGYLQSLAFRACRMVVDTGLHAKRWTRQQGVDFFVNENGSNPIEVAGEVDRYCAWPGQACGYKVGHSAINRLREKAQAELGAKYDFKAFNDAVVLGGSVPMTVLGDVIDGYIAGAAG